MPFRGFVLPTYLVLYGIMRFIVEFFRGDHNPTHFGGHLSDQQVFCIILVFVGGGLFWYLRMKRRTDASSSPTAPETS